MKKFLLVLLFTLLFVVVGCGGNDQTNSGDTPVTTPPSDGLATFTNIHPISYQDVNVERDMEKFYKETKNAKGSSHDAPHEYGFVSSVWHKLKVNGVSVKVYSARCGYGIHSFAWIDVETDGKFSLDIELEVLEGNYSKVTVLPEKENVAAVINDNVVTSTIENYGSFSFVFDEEAYMAMTLYVAPYSKLEVPEGYEVVEIEPGYYDNSEEASLDFTKREEPNNKVYLFKSGVYDITNITIPTNSIVYFERGTYMRVFEKNVGDYHAGLSSSGNNIKVLGRALFDFSKCIGGDAKTKGVYTISGCENVYIEGITTINSNNWSMCLNACKNAEVTRCMFFSYRTYSDGIMYSDCEDGYAHDNFVRTGDDAIEVKAFTNTANQTNNILFENNCVWTDKGIAYGCIYESVHDIENVYFKNNSVGFAQASWSNHLGCCVIQMGSMKQATWHDVHFENIEIYKTSCAAISLYNRASNEREGGKIRNIYFKDITVKYMQELNLPVYAINIVIKLADGVDYRNSTIGTLYIDNLTYLGEEITSSNYLDYTNIDLSEEAKFSKSNIKINTLIEEE